MVPAAAQAAERTRAASLPSLRVSSREKGDLIMLGIGGFTPLDGFMTCADWEGVCDAYRTASGLFWPIPITLSVDAATANQIRVGEDIALTAADDGALLATMTVTEKYAIDKARECAAIFRTTDPEHPGVSMVMQTAWLVTGRGVPNAQRHAPLARISRQGRHRGLRRRAGALAARQREAR